MNKSALSKTIIIPRDTNHEVIKILIADPIELGENEEAIDYMQDKGWHIHKGPIAETTVLNPGIHVSYQPDISVEEIISQSKGGFFDAAICAAKLLPKEALFKEGAVRMGAGVGNMCYTGGPLMNTPGQNSATTAEIVMQALLDSRMNLYAAHQEVINGTANSLNLRHHYKSGINGQRIAIIGTGNIGQEVIKRAQAFGMHVTAYSRSLTPEHAHIMGIRYASTPAEAVENADVVSIHTALTAETEGMINQKLLSHMKPSVTLINAARAPLMNANAIEQFVANNPNATIIIDADMYPEKDSPITPYRHLAKRYPKQFLLTAHIFADCDHPSRINAAICAIDSLERLFLERIVTNYAGDMVGQGPLPDGYHDGGFVGPEIGYSTVCVNS